MSQKLGSRVVDGMMSRTVSDAEEDEEVEFDAKGHGNSNGTGAEHSDHGRVGRVFVSHLLMCPALAVVRCTFPRHAALWRPGGVITGLGHGLAA